MWSDDASAIAYSAYTGKEKGEFVFAGSRRIGPNPIVKRILLAPDGRSAAYFTGQGAGLDLLVDGRKVASFGSSFHMPKWSRDGALLAYVAQEGEYAYLVAGDRKLGPYAKVYSIAWSIEGKLAYSAQEEGGWYVHDGNLKYGPFLDKATHLEYSPDGTALASSIWDGKATCLYVGGKKIGAYGELINDLAWSPDGRTISFRQDGAGLALHVGDKAFSGFHNAYTYWWSDDGSTLEYSTVLISQDGKDRDYSKVFLGGKMFTGGLSGHHVVYVDGASFVDGR